MFDVNTVGLNFLIFAYLLMLLQITVKKKREYN